MAKVLYVRTYEVDESYTSSASTTASGCACDVRGGLATLTMLGCRLIL